MFGKDLPDGIWTIAKLEPGQQSNGRIDSSDSDWYAIDLVANQLYAFSLIGLLNNDQPFSSTITLFNDDSQAIINAAHRFGPNQPRLMDFRPTKSGLYYLQMAAPQVFNQHNYSIIWREDDHGSEQGDQTTLTVGTKATGVLTPSQLQGFSDDDSDWFKIELDQGNIYRYEVWGVGTDNQDVGGNLQNAWAHAQGPFGPGTRRTVYNLGAGYNEIHKIVPRESGLFLLAVWDHDGGSNQINRTYTIFIEEAHTEVQVSYGAAAYDATSGTATVTVSLDQAPGREVEIPITVTHHGTTTTAIYAGVPETVTFSATETSKTFTVTTTAAVNTNKSVTLGFGRYLPREVTAAGTTTTRVTLSANTPPTSADADVTAAESTDYTFQASDFPFTDSNADDTLDSVKITTIPGTGFGTLELDGNAIASSNLPKTVTRAQLDADKLVFSPITGQFGDDYTSFKFKVNDSTADSGEHTMTVDVAADPNQIVLVSNISQTNSTTLTTDNTTGKEFTQGFHTGDEPGGYTLHSVGVALRHNGLTDSESFTLALYDSDGTGAPDSLITTLQMNWDHASHMPDGTVYFTAPETTLSPDTNYHIAVQSDHNAPGQTLLYATTSDTTSGLSAWSIESRHRSDGRLSASLHKVKIEVRGTAGLSATVTAGDDVETEGDDAEFTFTLSRAAPEGGITVNYTIEEIERRDRSTGGADEGELPYDFVAPADEGAKTVAFAQGDLSKTVTIPTVADSLHEEGGDYTNYLRATVITGTGYGPGANAVAELDLNEGGERPTASFRDAADGVTVSETVGSATVAITLTEPFAHSAEIVIATGLGSASRGDDYNYPSLVAEAFDPGNNTKSINIPIIDSLQVEETENLQLQLFSTPNGPQVSNTADRLSINITDDDSAELILRAEDSRG